MPKANGYAVFCMEKKKDHERRQGKKLSMAELINLCSPDWDALSIAERAGYKEKAKSMPRIGKTIIVRDVEEDQNDSDNKEFFRDEHAMEEKKQKDEWRLMTQEFLLQHISQDDRLMSMKTHELHVVAITPLYEHRINRIQIEAAPAEIAVLSFTLEEGVNQTFWSQIEIDLNDPQIWEKSEERECQHKHDKGPMAPDMTLPNINTLATKLTELTTDSKFMLYDGEFANALFACLKYLRQSQENEEGFFSDCFKNRLYRMISAAGQIFHFEATKRISGNAIDNANSSRKTATEVFSRKALMKSMEGEDKFNYYCDFHRLKEPEDAYDGCALAQARILSRQLFRFTASEYGFDPNDRDHDVCPQKFFFDEEKAKPSLSEQTLTTGSTLKSDSDFNECLNAGVVASEQNDNRLETENTTAPLQTPTISAENVQKSPPNHPSGARPKVPASCGARERFPSETADSRSSENKQPEYKDGNDKQYMTLVGKDNKVFFEQMKKEPIAITDKRDFNGQQCGRTTFLAIDNEVFDDTSFFEKKKIDLLPGLGRGRKV